MVNSANKFEDAAVLVSLNFSCALCVRRGLFN
ncbi:hypothetical protein E4N77_06985 [Treponema denticola]|nr:hypothetical protein E4N77_06985 [Treponema denticola]